MGFINQKHLNRRILLLITMKYKIALQSFLVLTLVLIGSSFIQASEVTGTLSSESGEVHGHGTTGSLSGSVASSNSNTGSTSSPNGTMGGTVTGGISGGTGSSNNGVSQNASSGTGNTENANTTANSDQLSFVSSDGTALESSSGNLAFGDFGAENPSLGDFGSEGDVITPAQVITSTGTGGTTWIWIALLILGSIAAFVYLYVRSTSKDESQAI